MPRRLLRLSRTDPARIILLVVAFLTMLMQLVTLTPWATPVAYAMFQAPNVAVVTAVCVWGWVSSGKNNIKHMSASSFWLSLMWLWSGLTRLAFSPDAGMLLWCPFLILACSLGVVHIYLSAQRKAGG